MAGTFPQQVVYFGSTTIYRTNAGALELAVVDALEVGYTEDLLR